MADGKQAGLWSVPLWVHCLIYTGATGGALVLAAVTSAEWEAGAGFDAIFEGLVGGSVWVVIALLLLSHWLIDGLQLADRWGRLLRQSRVAVVQTMVDQTLHLLVLAALAVWVGA